jgi:hypothetical protein
MSVTTKIKQNTACIIVYSTFNLSSRNDWEASQNRVFVVAWVRILECGAQRHMLFRFLDTLKFQFRYVYKTIELASTDFTLILYFFSIYRNTNAKGNAKSDAS